MKCTCIEVRLAFVLRSHRNIELCNVSSTAGGSGAPFPVSPQRLFSGRSLFGLCHDGLFLPTDALPVGRILDCGPSVDPSPSGAFSSASCLSFPRACSTLCLPSSSWGRALRVFPACDCYEQNLSKPPRICLVDVCVPFFWALLGKQSQEKEIL